MAHFLGRSADLPPPKKKVHNFFSATVFFFFCFKHGNQCLITPGKCGDFNTKAQKISRKAATLPFALLWCFGVNKQIFGGGRSIFVPHFLVPPKKRPKICIRRKEGEYEGKRAYFTA